MSDPAKHDTLAAALVAFQAEVPTLPKNATNPHFKSRFTPLDTIVEHVTPLLAKHGLSWSTFPTIKDGKPALRYQLAHTGGDVLSDIMPLLLTKEDSQGLGSAITYARRYSITAVLNLVADEDDDGNAASRSATTQNGGQRAQPVAAEPSNGPRLASAKQRGLMNVRASEANLAPSEFADAILRAGGHDAREFDDQEHAKNWVTRALDRLPAAQVDRVLEEIADTNGAPA